MTATLPNYELCVEHDTTNTLSIDFDGALTHQQVEEAMAAISRDPEDFGFDLDHTGGWDVRVMARHAGHPEDCDDPDNPGGPDCWCDWDQWYYRPLESQYDELRDGETLVTVIAPTAPTMGRRCYWHPDEWATAGIPDTLLQPLEIPDTAPWEDRGWGRARYLWACGPCHEQARDRNDVFYRQRLGEITRRREAGVPERYVRQ